MNSKTSLIILAIAAIVIVGFIVLRGPADAPTTTEEDSTTQEDSAANTQEEGLEEESSGDGTTTEEDDSETEQMNVIVYGSSGYSPREIRISVGETVTWRNESSAQMWPASAVHPTHTVYPGSNISLCGTAQAIGIFDACGGIATGGEYSFTFNEAGSWGYHDHLRASNTGRVIVE